MTPDDLQRAYITSAHRRRGGRGGWGGRPSLTRAGYPRVYLIGCLTRQAARLQLHNIIRNSKYDGMVSFAEELPPVHTVKPRDWMPVDDNPMHPIERAVSRRRFGEVAP